MPTDRQIEACHSFIRVAQCVRRHPVLAAEAAKSTALANLDAVITAIADKEQTQRVKTGEKVDLTSQIDEAAKWLRLELTGLQAGAQSVGIQASRGPKVFVTVNENHSWHEHIATARAMADLARQHESMLLKALPPNFIDELRKKADTLEELTRGRDDTIGLKHGARMSIPELVKAGRGTVAILEGNLGRVLTGSLRAEFDQAKSRGRVHRPKAKQQESAPAAETDTATAATTDALPLPPQALPQPPARPALPSWSGLMAFLTGRLAKDRQKEEVIDVDYTVEETKRLPPASEAG